MKYLSILAFIFLFAIGLAATEYKIDFVKSIGDEREDYTFFKINSIVMADNSKDIYVADLAGHFIAKYNWDGKFIKRIGQKGSGPGDFGIISSLSIYKNKLYVYDYENTRITEMGLDLTNIQMDFKDRRIRYLGALASLTMNLSPERDKLAISFFRPNNPVDFYVYNIRGEALKQFSYKADNKFRFPEHLLNLMEPVPATYYSLTVDSVFPYKNNYIVFYSEVSHLSEKDEKADAFCLIFNSSGELIQKIKIDEKLYFFHLSNEGYLLGSQLDADIGKVFIYQLKEAKK